VLLCVNTSAAASLCIHIIVYTVCPSVVRGRIIIIIIIVYTPASYLTVVCRPVHPCHSGCGHTPVSADHRSDTAAAVLEQDHFCIVTFFNLL
jgi:hypothetical protein